MPRFTAAPHDYHPRCTTAAPGALPPQVHYSGPSEGDYVRWFSRNRKDHTTERGGLDLLDTALRVCVGPNCTWVWPGVWG